MSDGVRIVSGAGLATVVAILLVPGIASATSEPLPPWMVTAWSTPGGIVLSWNPPLDDGGAPVEAYLVYQSNTDGVMQFVGSTDQLSFIHPSGGATTLYSVAARNQFGTSVPSNPTPPIMGFDCPIVKVAAYLDPPDYDLELYPNCI